MIFQTLITLTEFIVLKCLNPTTLSCKDIGVKRLEFFCDKDYFFLSEFIRFKKKVSYCIKPAARTVELSIRRTREKPTAPRNPP